MATKLPDTEFDVVVVGTGLPECMVAGACAKAGQSVLLMDKNPNYGAEWSTFNLEQFQEWMEKQIETQTDSSLYHNFEIVMRKDGEFYNPKEYCIDLAPKVMFAGGQLLETIVRAGAHHALDIMLLQASYVLYGGQLVRVPCSRSDIFCDSTLSTVDKRLLTRFIKMCQDAAQGKGELMEEENQEKDFGTFLTEAGLNPKLKDIILYGIILLQDYQINSDSNTDMRTTTLTVSQAKKQLQKFTASLGRFGLNSNPFLVIMYGFGEIAQSFSRTCAVYGGITVLSLGIEKFELDSQEREQQQQQQNQEAQQEEQEEQETSYQKVCSLELTNGQTITCKKVLGSSQLLQQLHSSQIQNLQINNVEYKVSRCVCITESSFREGEDTIMITVPPSESKYPYVIRLLQFGNVAKVAPKNRYVVYLSTRSNGDNATEDLLPLIEQLFDIKPSSPECEQEQEIESKEGEEEEREQEVQQEQVVVRFKPRALSYVCYNQVIPKFDESQLPENVAIINPPLEQLVCTGIVHEVQRLFDQINQNQMEQTEIFTNGKESGEKQDDDDGADEDEADLQALQRALNA